MNDLKKVYLDNAATTKVSKSVEKAMKPFFCKTFGNESSSHTFGRDANKFVEQARHDIAQTINAETNEIYFTSCGSESNSWAIVGLALANKEKGNHIITTKIEHDSILNACKFLESLGFEVTYLGVDNLGHISLNELEKVITDKTILVSVMTANNEVGTIEDIASVGKICQRHKVLFHTDAVQAYGVLKFDVKALHIDAMSVSGHKIYGPKGSGMLYVRNGVKINSLIFGGNQEFGKRGGTLNTSSVVGFGMACKQAYQNIDKTYAKLCETRKYFVESLQNAFNDHIIINGDQEKTVPQIISVTFKQRLANIILIKLDQMGIAVSRGSACTAGSELPSYVLQAMSLSDGLNSTIRFSISKHTLKWEIDYTIKCLKQILNY